MSDEMKLPDELAACEARLAAQPLPQPAINRDQLMYQAGWAACEAHLRGETVPSAPRPGGRIAAVWSVASTVIAASLALVLVLQERPAPQLAPTADLATSSASEGATAGDSSRLPQVAQATPATRSHSSVRTLGSGLLALRRQALLNIWPEPVQVTAVDAAASDTAHPTRDELLHELLPAESGDSIKIWSPTGRRMGDSI